MPIHEHLFEHADGNGRQSLIPSLGMGMKVVRFEGLVFLWVAVAVGNQGHDSGGLVPVMMAAGFRHPDQFPQRQEPGIDAEDSGEFPNEAIAVSATESGSNVFSVVSA